MVSSTTEMMDSIVSQLRHVKREASARTVKLMADVVISLTEEVVRIQQGAPTWASRENKDKIQRLTEEVERIDSGGKKERATLFGVIACLREAAEVSGTCESATMAADYQQRYKVAAAEIAQLRRAEPSLRAIHKLEDATAEKDRTIYALNCRVAELKQNLTSSEIDAVAEIEALRLQVQELKQVRALAEKQSAEAAREMGYLRGEVKRAEDENTLLRARNKVLLGQLHNPLLGSLGSAHVRLKEILESTKGQLARSQAEVLRMNSTWAGLLQTPPPSDDQFCRCGHIEAYHHDSVCAVAYCDCEGYCEGTQP